MKMENKTCRTRASEKGNNEIEKEAENQRIVIGSLPFEILKTSMLKDAEKLEEVANNSKTCRTCANRERWECGSKIIQYCGVRKSNRTFNKLQKIKVTNPACHLYKEEEQ